MSEETQQVTKDDIWYIDNYIVLIDYYDRTISRIAARCVRHGNIALEEYPFYPYVIDVLEEICETGDFIVNNPALYPYVERKIAGGIEALKNNLAMYKDEITKNQTLEMVKQESMEKQRQKLKDTLNEGVDKSVDPTVGAGMNIDELMDKLMHDNNIDPEAMDADRPVDNGQ